MATLQELEDAFVKADDAALKGDKQAAEDAAAFAAQIRKMRMMPKPQIETPAFEKEAARTLEKPTTGALAWNSTMKGLASVPDAILNTPNNLMNLGKAAAGSVAVAAGRPDLAPDITPNPDLIRRGLTAVGAIDPIADPKTGGQKVLDSAIQAGAGMALMPSQSVKGTLTNMLYGSASGATGNAVEQATGSPIAGMAASMLTPLALDQANVSAVRRLDALKGKESLNQERDATLRAARDAGYVFPPSHMTDTGMLNNALESLGGKAALKQEATRRNIETTQRLAAQELGLPENTAINQTVLRQYRDTVSQPFRELQAINPTVATIFDRLRNVREQAQAAWREYNGPNHPRAALNDAQRLDGFAARLESQLDSMAQSTGNAGLMDRVRDARVKLAKSYEIERALNPADATVSAKDLAASLDRGRKLTGNLETIAKTGLSGTTRPFMGDAAPTPGVSALAPVSAGLGISGSAASGNLVPALMGAGIPLMRGPARSILLSDAYQNLMQPSYNGGLLTRALAGLEQPTPQQLGLAGLIGAR